MIFNPNFDSCRFPGLEGDFVGYIFQKTKSGGHIFGTPKAENIFFGKAKAEGSQRAADERRIEDSYNSEIPWIANCINLTMESVNCSAETTRLRRIEQVASYPHIHTAFFTFLHRLVDVNPKIADV